MAITFWRICAAEQARLSASRDIASDTFTPPTIAAAAVPPTTPLPPGAILQPLTNPVQR